MDFIVVSRSLCHILEFNFSSDFNMCKYRLSCSIPSNRCIIFWFRYFVSFSRMKNFYVNLSQSWAEEEWEKNSQRLRFRMYFQYLAVMRDTTCVCVDLCGRRRCRRYIISFCSFRFSLSSCWHFQYFYCLHTRVWESEAETDYWRIMLEYNSFFFLKKQIKWE